MRNSIGLIHHKVEEFNRKTIDEYLIRIINILIVNSSFIKNLGLLNGKIGISIFLYRCANHLKSKPLKKFADELIDEINDEISLNISSDFGNGLTGIGWGIEYLVQSRFIRADTDKVLEDIDNYLYQVRMNSPLLIQDGGEVFGYGLYHIMRLKGHKIDDYDLNTLIKKYHLIFLADECERILLKKLYKSLNIESLSLETINSFVWFLLELVRFKIYPSKVRKILREIFTDFLKENFPFDADKVSRLIFSQLTSKIIEVSGERRLLKPIEYIVKQKDEDISIRNPLKVSIELGKLNVWQYLTYSEYLDENYNINLLYSNVFSLIKDENSWNTMLESLNNSNLGLSGLAGIGLVLLMIQHH